LGVALAWLSGRLVSVLLVGVRPFDPLTLIVVTSGLGIVAGFAAAVPAARAAQTDPVSTLRAE
jgi:hypothetical protein